MGNTQQMTTSTDKLASKGFTKGTATTKAKAATPTPATVAELSLTSALVKTGKAIWQWWTGKEKPYVKLGIREKTATKTGTRAAMLAVAAYGYSQGQGKVLAQAVRAAQGNNPHVGGIDFPWLEKLSNMQTITPSAAIRPDAKDGKMRLMVLTGTGKAKVSAASKVATADKPKAAKPAASKATSERRNGEVTVSRMTDAELAKLQADANNG
jgi:hypothetical protein